MGCRCEGVGVRVLVGVVDGWVVVVNPSGHCSKRKTLSWMVKELLWLGF